MSSLRIAIVGSGRMGNERARSCKQAGINPTLACDSNVVRAEELAKNYSGCRVLAKPEELPYSKLDAIFICTPPGQRGNVELGAISAGVPFFVEKPIGISAAAALPILEALAARPVIHAVGYMNRYRSSVQYARSMINQCCLLGISAYWVGRKYGVPWWLDIEESGGPLNEQATHIIDMCRYLVGEVTTISTCCGNAAPILTCAATLSFKKGCLASIFYSCEAQEKHIGFRIITAEGGLDLSGWDLRLTSNTIDGTLQSNDMEDIFFKETAQFLHAVANNAPHLIECTFQDAFCTQQLIDQMRHCNEIARK